jgi:hypothetical protein
LPLFWKIDAFALKVSSDTTMILNGSFYVLLISISDTAKYKKPILRFKNVKSGKYLTVENDELIQKAGTSGVEQEW